MDSEPDKTVCQLYVSNSRQETHQQGEIVAIGKGKRLGNGKMPPLDVQPGDRILFERCRGVEVQLDGHEYLMIREDDVIGVIDSTKTRSTRLPRRAVNFDTVYRTTPRWDIGRAQSAFLALAKEGVLRGRLLDVGCGTGEHVLMGAALGLDATGVDSASVAIGRAKTKAQARGLKARFVVWDALELISLGEQFDTVLDCGLFHILEDEDRPLFVQSLRTVIRPGGHYFMLCFSDREPGKGGPRRITQEEIRTTFDIGWQVKSIESATIETTVSRGGILAWLARIIRL
jgi:co-chaperonin GroES (HSP10)